jgi:FkbM family methyltransferase
MGWSTLRAMSRLIAPWRERARLEAEAAKLRRDLEKAQRSAWKEQRPYLVPLEYDGAEIQIHAATKLARKRKNAARKEPFTVEWLESLPAGDVLYDIGANVGPYALIAARRPQGALRVVAFEPGFANYAVLCENVVLNDAADDIMPVPVTLGAEDGVGYFRYSDVSGGAALHAGGVDVPVESVYDQRVLVFALDTLVERFGLPAPNHVKLDVDGAELVVLQGARSVLADADLRSVMLEVSADQAEPVRALLESSGLACAETHRRSPGARFWYERYARSS